MKRKLEISRRLRMNVINPKFKILNPRIQKIGEIRKDKQIFFGKIRRLTAR